MEQNYSDMVYHGLLIRGNLTGAIAYLKQFPEQAELYRRYMYVFEEGRLTDFPVAPRLNRLLAAYQRYYRDAFYLCMDKEDAEAGLRAGLAGALGIDPEGQDLDSLEENQVAEAFQAGGFSFLGGRTGGFYGPYIWRDTQAKTYPVQLPDGVQNYTVKLLDGFLSLSWLDYLSFGAVGTGGWCGKDGIIHCVRASYDLEGENFQVSLLKHEAQHARDLEICPDMDPEDLEYRAKLVELIYSTQRDQLSAFFMEAGRDSSSTHGAASTRVIGGYARVLGLTSPRELMALPRETVQAVARELFAESWPDQDG